MRVVARKRHRMGKICWYATNTPRAELTASDVIRLYFDRWPAQEPVYRDGSGIVGLDVHHGCGKKKIDNVAVLDRLQGRIRRWEESKSGHEDKLAPFEGTSRTGRTRSPTWSRR